MKRFLYIAICYFISITNINAVDKNDSIRYDKLTNELNALQLKVDSLTTITEKFEVEKNYFQTALNTQTGIFVLIITLFTALIGYISLKQIERKIKEYKKESDDMITLQNDNLTEFEMSIKEQREVANRTTGNLYAHLANYYKDTKGKQGKELFVIFTILAAYEFSKADKTSKVHEFLLRAKESIEDLNKINNIHINKHREYVDKALSELIKNEDEKVKVAAIQLYADFTRIDLNT